MALYMYREYVTTNCYFKLPLLSYYMDIDIDNYFLNSIIIWILTLTTIL